MIAGAHLLLYSKDPETDRAFFKTVLKFPSIDLGEGWLIFALPPAELGVHPGDGEFVRCKAWIARPQWKLTGESVRVFDCRVEAKSVFTYRLIPR
jgi:hypothetical protein